MDAKTWKVGMALAMALASIACQRGGGGSFSVNARTVAPAGGAPAAGGALDLGAGITLTRVRLAVQRIRLEGGTSGDGMGGASSDGTGAMNQAERSDGGDGEEVTVGPLAVDLGGDALSGGVQHVLDAQVPPGVYDELRIDVGPVDSTAAGKDAALAALGTRSVVIDGTVDGEAFTFESSLTTTQKTEMTIRIGGSGGAAGVTLTIDPRGWFVGRDGMRLDPRVATNRPAIEDAIRSSIGAELEEGDDRGGHGGAGGDGMSGGGDGGMSGHGGPGPG